MRCPGITGIGKKKQFMYKIVKIKNKNYYSNNFD